MTTIAPRITVGVDTHLDVHVAAALDDRGSLLGVESFPTTPAGYRELSVGCKASAKSSSSGSRAPAVTAPASPVTCLDTISGSSRSTVRTANGVGAGASPTPKTPSPRLARPKVAKRRGSRRPETATSNRCVCCGWRDPRRAKDGPGRSTRCGASSRPHRTRFDQSFVSSASTRCSSAPAPIVRATGRDIVSLTKRTLEDARQAGDRPRRRGQGDRRDLEALVAETAPELVAVHRCWHRRRFRAARRGRRQP